MKIFLFILINLMYLSLDAFEFPKDHSFHKDFQIEWCYFVGNLKAKTGQDFGYELSFFRANMRGKKEIFPVHFAISNLSTKRHYTSQSLERRIGNLAAYTSYVIKNGDYKIEILGEAKFRISAKPRKDLISLDLLLTSTRNDILLHGKEGYSQKSNLDSNIYSYYYSIPRLITEGYIQIESQRFEIESGTSWMDHEWSAPEKDSSELKSTIVSEENSWDWLCLNLSDGSDLMLFNFRKNKNTEPETFGTFRDSNGRIETFKPDGKMKLESLNEIWKSPITNKNYPMKWKVIGEDLNLVVETRFNNQEFIGFKTTGNTYWEGAIVATGIYKKQKINGKGYLELKGY
ncbi:MAG TPA: lipocalin-like domain-containing protein [Leptospiraceae bacterium]|nr:lipocalin-like domain-containing protein [Leptospiraceae bacterium]HNB97671.1 lipocalin-like domain-containing protein [Leptospiraceae bacterium]HNE06950.1 lipocalin-like domain-containing protein [Leptospiraceae bacterium]HNG98604.1 lipocalin-like domain-containing protein [Leptospiraceae bacterium]HNI88507.1 lipocalin-like domain-containing protein [Leptospiraceae bacterium]